MGNPPFNPGDRVIHIGDTDESGIAHNEKYTVESASWCCERAGWRLYLVEIIMEHHWECIYCNRHGPGWPSENFRKIDEDISTHTAESLLEQLSEPVRELEPA
jgi:hypothetical protein